MDQGPLVSEQIDAGARLIDAFGQYAPVQAAFWVRERGNDQWYLYLTSDQIDDTNFDLAYGEILRILGKGPHLWLDPFQVKVTSLDEPVTKDVIALMNKYPGRLPMWYHGRLLGGLSIEEAYIYPIPITLPA